MPDDITPTNPEPIEVLAAQLAALRKHPEDGDLYFELRTALRKRGQAEPIAEIGELHAPFEKDRRRAADIWSEAGEARLLLGHDEQGEADFFAFSGATGDEIAVTLVQTSGFATGGNAVRATVFAPSGGEVITFAANTAL